jgi:hypothetical protein
MLTWRAYIGRLTVWCAERLTDVGGRPEADWLDQPACLSKIMRLKNGNWLLDESVPVSHF